MTDPVLLTALEQAALIRTGQLSSVELLTAYLDRIDRINPTVRAMVTVDGDAAIAAARRADQLVAAGDAAPPFRGVPIAIKDVTETAGMRTTYSSRPFATNVPARDAAIVERLRLAGFVLVGKTNMPEFALLGDTVSLLNGACVNPWDLTRSPGGSSGGSAAAVACGLVPLAQGTDGGGSVRAPASCCGVVGVKPSRGAVSTLPLVADPLSTLVTDGIVGRSIRDCAAALDAMAVTRQPIAFLVALEQALPRLRVGVMRRAPDGRAVNPDCLAAVDNAAQRLAGLGHEVSDDQPTWPDLEPALSILGPASMAGYDTVNRDQFEPATQALLRIAAGVSSLDYARAAGELTSYGLEFLRFWAHHDVLLTPTLASPPMPSGWLGSATDLAANAHREGEFSPFTAMANVTGQPAISLPMWSTAGGLPVGIHLIGAPHGDAQLLALAAALEHAQPWSHCWPPI